MKQEGYLERTVAHIDIGGFTRLTNEIEADEAATILTNIFNPLVALALNYQGNIVGFEGDGITIDFEKPEDALNFALSAQNMGNIETLDGKKLLLSTGISTGDVFVSKIKGDRRDKYFYDGPATTKAHDLEFAASDGQIFVDKETYEKSNKDIIIPTPTFLPLSKNQYLVTSKEKINVPLFEQQGFEVLTYVSPRLKDFSDRPEKKQLTVSVATLEHINSAIRNKEPKEKVDELIEQTLNTVKETIGERGNIGAFRKELQIIYGLDNPIQAAQICIGACENLSQELKKLNCENLSIGIETGYPFIGKVCEGAKNEESAVSLIGSSVNLAYRLNNFLQKQKSSVIAFGPETKNRVLYLVKSQPLEEKFRGFPENTPAFLYEGREEKFSRADIFEDIFVNREDEMSKLLAAKKTVRDEERDIVVAIKGDSGIGKTSLIEHFIEEYIIEDVQEIKILKTSPKGSEHFSLFRPFLSEKTLEEINAINNSNKDFNSKYMECSNKISQELGNFENKLLYVDDLDRADESSFRLVNELADTDKKRNLFILYTQPNNDLLTRADSEIALDGLTAGASKELANEFLRRLYRSAILSVDRLKPEERDKFLLALDSTLGNPLAIRELVFNWTATRDPERATIDDILASSLDTFSGYERKLIDILALNKGEMQAYLIPKLLDASEEEISEGIDILLNRRILDKTNDYYSLRNRRFIDIAVKKLTTKTEKILRSKIVDTLMKESTDILKMKDGEDKREYYKRVSREMPFDYIMTVLEQSLELQDAKEAYKFLRFARHKASNKDLQEKGERLLHLYEKQEHVNQLRGKTRESENLEKVLEENQETYETWREHAATLAIMNNVYSVINNVEKVREISSELEEICGVFSGDVEVTGDFGEFLYSLKNNLHHSLSFAYWSEGKFDEARKEMQSLLELSIKEGKHSEIIGVYNNLGIISIYSGNYNEALEFFDYAEESAKKHTFDDERYINELLWTRNNKAHTLIKMGREEDLKEAEILIDEVEKCKGLYEDNSQANKRLLSLYLTRIGLYWTQLEKGFISDSSREGIRQKAYEDSKKSLKLAEEIFYPLGIADSNLMLSLLEEDRNQAINHYDSALNLIKKYNLPEQEFFYLEFAKEKFN